ncbi:MAG TPA: GntR family transcriptional regulator [Chloroflexota bacterium]|jgi:DNA-binding GntR family transcriptional regulator|nr:GntR family transcriptional regulator [Chloroflexota bacterium]
MPIGDLAANPPEHASLQEKVYQQLKQAILAGEIRPGERLLETQIAASLGVSRIPLREAIRKLERDGLVVFFPRRGIYASALSARDVDEIYAVRAVLEGLSARLAAERHTLEDLARIDEILSVMAHFAANNDSAALFQAGRDFHQVVLEAAGSRKLAQITELMYGQVERVRQLRMRLTRRCREVYREYVRIRDAIAARDGARAEREMRAHVERPRRDLRQMLEADDAAAT